MSLNSELRRLLDCDVTLYVGAHVLKGSIGQTDDDVVVLHTETGLASFRIELVSGYIHHSYIEPEQA